MGFGPATLKNWALTEKGAKYFTAQALWPTATLFSKFRIHPDIAVTGIMDAGVPSIKIVEYVLTYHNDYPDEVRTVGHLKEWNVNGKLTARLYDDGWRAER
jgi:hypothetical protein